MVPLLISPKMATNKVRIADLWVRDTLSAPRKVEVHESGFQ